MFLEEIVEKADCIQNALEQTDRHIFYDYDVEEDVSVLMEHGH